MAVKVINPLQAKGEQWKIDKEVSDMRDAQISLDAQESLLEEIHDIADHHETDSWSEIKNHLTINKPKV
jgi:hypothetical protein